MPSLKFNILVDNKAGKVAMEQFANETDAAFKRAAAAVSKVSLSALPEHEQAVVKVQRRYQALGTQIDQLAKSGRITSDMAAKWHNDVGTRMKGDLSALEKQGQESFGRLANYARMAAIAMAGMGLKRIFTEGLEAVEDYSIKVASLSAFITTFSQKTTDGDLAGGFKDALGYAQRLVPALEMIDSKTIASGKDLGVMAETMAMNGVLLDIDNQKQVKGFINIANALKLVTAGQNQDIQMRQEINALLQGQIRATDRLPKLLAAIDPELEAHLKLWKAQGTTVEHIGEMLQGFGASADLIEQTWAAVGSSLETVKDRVLRDGFKPAYVDLLAIANEIRSSLVDAEGQLTPLAKKIQGEMATAYDNVKVSITSIKAIYDTLPDWMVGPAGIGLVGGIMFGKKGALMLASGAVVADYAKDMARLAGLASGGQVGWGDIATAGHDDRKQLLADFEAKQKGERAAIEKALAAAVGRESQLRSTGGDLIDRMFGDPKELAKLNREIASYQAQLKALDLENKKVAAAATAPKLAPAPMDQEAKKKMGKELAAAQKKEAAEVSKAHKEALDDLSGQMDALAHVQDAYSSATLSSLSKEEQAVAKVAEEYRKKRYAVQDAARLGLPMSQDPAEIMAGLDTQQAAENLEILNKLEKEAYAYDSALEKVGETGKSVAEDMDGAFKNWASNMSKDFNEVLWGAEVTFDGILESFGKMITQMMIQESIVAPLKSAYDSGGGVTGMAGSVVEALFGSSGAGTPEAFSQVSAYDSMMTNPTFSYASGIDYVPSDRIAKIHEGERVVPASQNNGGGGVQVNVINNASGTQATATERTDSGGARIIDVLVEQIEGKMGARVAQGKGLAPVFEGRYALNSAYGMAR